MHPQIDKLNISNIHFVEYNYVNYNTLGYGRSVDVKLALNVRTITFAIIIA